MKTCIMEGRGRVSEVRDQRIHPRSLLEANLSFLVPVPVTISRPVK